MNESRTPHTHELHTQAHRISELACMRNAGGKRGFYMCRQRHYAWVTNFTPKRARIPHSRGFHTHMLASQHAYAVLEIIEVCGVKEYEVGTLTNSTHPRPWHTYELYTLTNSMHARIEPASQHTYAVLGVIDVGWSWNEYELDTLSNSTHELYAHTHRTSEPSWNEYELDTLT